MAGGSDLQPSKSAKNAATCKKRQGADAKKKKQSCDINEISHKEKNNDDHSGKKKEVVGIKKEKEDGNRNTGEAINIEEEVLKNGHKLSELSVNKEDCNVKGAANINEAKKCSNVNNDKGILNKNDGHKKKDALGKETSTFIKGVASVGENDECSNYKDTNKNAQIGHDANKKVIIKESESEDIDQVNLGNKITGATKNKETDICNNNIESHKKDDEVKAVNVIAEKKDAKKTKKSSAKEDCITEGGNDSVSSGDKDLPIKSSPKKKQFGNNYRVRGSYGNNRGRNFNWRGGWGNNNYNRFQNRRMMNSGHSAAHRGNNQPRSNYSESARAHMKASTPFHPEAPPQAFFGSLQPMYFDSPINYQDCYYFPQVWPPQQLGTYYRETLDISDAHATVGENEVTPYKSYAGDVIHNTAIEVSKENVKTERKDLDHHELRSVTEGSAQAQPGHGIPSNIIASVSSNPLFELGKSFERDQQLVKAYAGIEMRPSVQLPPEYGLQWYFIQYGAKLPPNVIPVMVVPFISGADSVHQARQDSHGGQDQGFPPSQSHAGQEQGFPPPQSHAGHDQGFPPPQSLRQDGHAGYDQGFPPPQSHGGQDQGFPPPQSLLPSCFNNVDLQTPSPVDNFQSALHTWPNQVVAPMSAANQAMAPMTTGNQAMAPMTTGNPAQYAFPSNDSSQTEIHTENKFMAK